MGETAVDDVLVSAEGASRELDAPSHDRGELMEGMVRGDSWCLRGQVGFAFVLVTIDVEGIGELIVSLEEEAGPIEHVVPAII